MVDLPAAAVIQTRRISYSRFAFTAWLALVIGGCQLRGDPTYYLYARNSTSVDLLVREVYNANLTAGIADPVHLVAPGVTQWVTEAQTGYGPDAIEILSVKCDVLAKIDRDVAAGGVEVNAELNAVIKPNATAPANIQAMQIDSRCANR